MKQYLTTILLALTLPIGELHTFWEKGQQRYENWIINSYQSMTVQWNVKFAGDEVNWILYFIAMWFFGKYPNKVNKITVGVFIGLAVVDLCFYFWNFKTLNYHYVYFGMAAVWAFVYFRQSLKKRLFG